MLKKLLSIVFSLFSILSWAAPDEESLKSDILKIAENFSVRQKGNTNKIKSAVVEIAKDPLSIAAIEKVRELVGSEELTGTAVELVKAYRKANVSLVFASNFYSEFFQRILDEEQALILTKVRIRFLEIEVIEFKKATLSPDYSNRLLEVILNNSENKHRPALIRLMAELVRGKLFNFSEEAALIIFLDLERMGRIDDLMPIFMELSRAKVLPNSILERLVTIHVGTGDEYDLTLKYSRRANGVIDFYSQSTPRIEMGPTHWLTQLIMSAPDDETQARMFDFVIQNLDAHITGGTNVNVSARKIQFINDFKGASLEVIRGIPGYADQVSRAKADPRISILDFWKICPIGVKRKKFINEEKIKGLKKNRASYLWGSKVPGQEYTD